MNENDSFDCGKLRGLACCTYTGTATLNFYPKKPCFYMSAKENFQKHC